MGYNTEDNSLNDRLVLETGYFIYNTGLFLYIKLFKAEELLNLTIQKNYGLRDKEVDLIPLLDS